MQKDLTSYTEKQLEEAFEIFREIKPFLQGRVLTKACIADLTKRLGKSRSSIFRYMKKYQTTPKTSSLIPAKPGRKPLSRALLPQQEEILDATINRVYLSKKRASLSETLIAVNNAMVESGYPKIHRGTLEHRIETIPDSKAIQKRHGAKEAAHQFRISKGSMTARKPLEKVLIDHTKLNVMVVDPIVRKCIGRPFLTCGIDVYSRAICCAYFSMEAPSSIGLMKAMSHLVSPKADWLRERGIEASWPVYGIPDCVSTDHGTDFMSRAFAVGLIEYGIEHDQRPIAQPHYGGIVERFFGTLNSVVHGLAGTTKSNVSERGSLDPANSAIYTLDELEKILLTYIVEVYMKTEHSTLLASPLAVWNSYWENAK